MRKLVLYINTGFANCDHREEIGLDEFLADNKLESVDSLGFEEAALEALTQFRLNTIEDGFFVLEADGSERRDW